MPRNLRRSWFWWRRRLGSPFSRINRLDLWRPHDYPTVPPGDHQQRQEQVRQLVGELAPGAVDEGTGEVLHNLINAWADQDVARIEHNWRSHQNLLGWLIGATAEELAKQRPQYEADLAEVERTAQLVAELGARLSGRTRVEGER